VLEKVATLAAYKMAKGLCRRCGEKWSKAHKCAASVQLNALQEVWNLLEPDLNLEQPFCQSESDSDQICLAISEAALSGKESPKTLKLRGTIQGIQILILVDSGSSHSFLSVQVADQLQGVTPSVHPSQVRVANGSILQSH
jgi:hypothetical protein